jgi:2-polyprenyl-3-methyl-5-hydroxy-6-metoxy-1,4-benzoquinol methylase
MYTRLKRLLQSTQTAKRDRRDRKSKILSIIDKGGIGLEIGPSHNPVAPKSEGFRVSIIDHLDKNGLKRKYAEHGLDVSRIEDVDYVWNGQRYSELVGGTGKFDWIIASHVAEHVPDLIGFLIQCEEILKPSGVLVLVVPDKRCCFDLLRPKTGLGQVIDAHIAGRTSHSPGTAAEYHLGIVTLNGAIAWPHLYDKGLVEFIHSARDAENAMASINKGEYIDLHSWTFTPNSFRLLMHDLNTLGLIKLTEAHFFDTQNVEFIVGLSPQSVLRSTKRLELAMASHAEGF